MATITFLLPNGTKKTVEAQDGLSIMEIAHKNDIYEIEGACGGSLACATCHVIFDDASFESVSKHFPKSEEEEDMLDLAFGLEKNSRLSCQILMKEELNGITIKIPHE